MNAADLVYPHRLVRLKHAWTEVTLVRLYIHIIASWILTGFVIVIGLLLAVTTCAGHVDIHGRRSGLIALRYVSP